MDGCAVTSIHQDQPTLLNQQSRISFGSYLTGYFWLSSCFSSHHCLNWLITSCKAGANEPSRQPQGPAHTSKNTHTRPLCCTVLVLKCLVHECIHWCLYVYTSHTNTAVDRMWGSMSYFICLSQWITLHAATHAFTQAFTHTDTCTWIHCIPLAMFGESKPRSNRVHCACKHPDLNKTTDTHIS